MSFELPLTPAATRLVLANELVRLPQPASVDRILRRGMINLSDFRFNQGGFNPSLPISDSEYDSVFLHSDVNERALLQAIEELFSRGKIPLRSSDAHEARLTYLSDRDLEAVRRRFGLKDGQLESYRSIGKALGVTGSRIASLIDNSMIKLQDPVRLSALRNVGVDLVNEACQYQRITPQATQARVDAWIQRSTFRSKSIEPRES